MTASQDHHALSLALWPRARRNGRRVALIQEGGGMRGAFGAGVQAGFAEAGLPFDAFDALYGSSAGALNLMYWVSRRPRAGTRVYVDELGACRDPLPSFFLYRTPGALLGRLMRGLPVLDLGAVGRAMSVACPIDIGAVRAHHAPIMFPLTRADRLSTELIDARSLGAEDVLPSLLAGASVPVLADSYDLGGVRFIDGACGAPLPVTRALEDGCTDLVVILTLPRWNGPEWYETLILRALAGRRGLPPSVAQAVGEGRRQRKAALRALRRPPRAVNVTIIAPEARIIGSLEQRRSRIQSMVEAGVVAGRGAVDLARAGRPMA